MRAMGLVPEGGLRCADGLLAEHPDGASWRLCGGRPQPLCFSLEFLFTRRVFDRFALDSIIMTRLPHTEIRTKSALLILRAFRRRDLFCALTSLVGACVARTIQFILLVYPNLYIYFSFNFGPLTLNFSK